MDAGAAWVAAAGAVAAWAGNSRQAKIRTIAYAVRRIEAPVVMTPRQSLMQSGGDGAPEGAALEAERPHGYARQVQGHRQMRLVLDALGGLVPDLVMGAVGGHVVEVLGFAGRVVYRLGAGALHQGPRVLPLHRDAGIVAHVEVIAVGRQAQQYLVRRDLGDRVVQV